MNSVGSSSIPHVCLTDRPLIKHSRYRTSQISDENEGGNYLPEITVPGLEEEEEEEETEEEEVQHAIPPSLRLLCQRHRQPQHTR